jgi:squalene cyclase
MLTRRHFFTAAGAALAAPALADDPKDEAVNGAKDMITAEAQKAIDRGLAYLAQAQKPDGSWGDRQYVGNVAVVSLAGLAFMAGGHQPGRGHYGKVVEKALDYVMSKEAKDQGRTPGYLCHNSTQFGGMYSHGFGALFLAEAYGMAPKPVQKRLRDTLERAVKLIVDSQNKDGGWRYNPRPETADVSVTICQIMALRSARNAGLTVPKATVERCIKYVRSCQNPDDGGFSYMAHQRGQSAFARSAAGVCALYCAGVYEGKDIEKGLDYLRRPRPNNGFGRMGRDEMHYYYGQYYAAQAMWTAGGDYWKEWFPAVREELLSRVRFQATGVWGDAQTCTDYATAMACIILQIPNNYLPILQM